MMKALVLLSLLVVCTQGGRVQKRGVVEEVGNIFGQFASGFDNLRKEAREEFFKTDPYAWAEQLENEMAPAMAKVEERLGSALDQLGFTFGNERRDPHIVDTDGIFFF